MLVQKIKYAQTTELKPTEKIAVIIPCYNEARRLPLDAFLNFARDRDDVRLIFVDDGSKDETISLLCAAMTALPDKVDGLVMKQNGGKAEAVRQGLRFAARQGHKYIAFLDADLATPIDAVLDFASVADRMPSIDVVFGSRKGGLGHKVYREFHRKIVSFICAALGRLATGLPIHDTQCGAKLFRNTPQFWQSLDKPFTAGWLFDVELFLRVSNPDRKKRGNFFEFPVIEWTEIAGSKIKTSDILKSGLKMLGLILNQWKIRQDYFSQVDINQAVDFQILRCGENLGHQDLQDAESYIDPDASGLVLDFCAVKTVAPSVFTSLIGFCDRIEQRGVNLKVRLPDDKTLIQRATQTGFTTLFDCVQVSCAPEKLALMSDFDMVEI